MKRILNMMELSMNVINWVLDFLIPHDNNSLGVKKKQLSTFILYSDIWKHFFCKFYQIYSVTVPFKLGKRFSWTVYPFSQSMISFDGWSENENHQMTNDSVLYTFELSEYSLYMRRSPSNHNSHICYFVFKLLLLCEKYSE